METRSLKKVTLVLHGTFTLIHSWRESSFAPPASDDTDHVCNPSGATPPCNSVELDVEDIDVEDIVVSPNSVLSFKFDSREYRI